MMITKYAIDIKTALDRIPGKKAIVFIGLPGSGKTTFAKNYFPVTEDYEYATRISSDDYIERIAEYNHSDYNSCFKDHIKDANRYYEKNLEYCIHHGHYSFYIDRTNLNSAKRKTLVEKIKKLGFTVVSVLFECPLEIAIQRQHNKNRDKCIPDNVIESMHTSFQPISGEEGFDYSYTLCYSHDNEIENVSDTI